MQSPSHFSLKNISFIQFICDLYGTLNGHFDLLLYTE